MPRRILLSTFFLLLFSGTSLFANSSMLPKVIQPLNVQAPWLTFLLLGCVTLYWVAYRNTPMFLRNKFQLVMHSKDRGSFYSASVRSQTTSYSLFLGAYFISFSIFVYQIINRLTSPQSSLVFVYSLLAIIGYQLLKYLIYSGVIRFLFMEKGAHSLIAQSYLFMNIILGALLFPINIVLTYTNDALYLNIAAGLGIFIFVGYCIVLSYKLFSIFFRDVSSLFYMILYLCTLEILPYWVLLKMGLKTLIINE